MKRKNFLFTRLTTVPFATAGMGQKGKLRPGKSFKVAAGEGRYHGHIQLKGVSG
jgi:hypothetical protein